MYKRKVYKYQIYSLNLTGRSNFFTSMVCGHVHLIKKADGGFRPFFQPYVIPGQSRVEDDVGGGVPGADECGDLEPLGLHLGLRMSYDGNIGLDRKLMSASLFVVFLAQLL